MSSPSISAEPPYAGAPPDGGEPGRGRAYLVTAMFLAPAVILLAVWILYPLVYTIWRSFYDRSGANFIWFDNYQTLFTTDTTRTAIKNNADLGRGGAGAGHGDRARLRRADRAHPLGGGVQDRRLHADGGVALRRRRDLADHVPAGAVAGRAQRHHRVGPRQGAAARAALGRLALRGPS